MKILIACEHSQTVGEQFIKKGHDVMTCDLFDGDKGHPHYKGNVLDIINDGYDMVIGFPPCTYLSKAQQWKCNKDWVRWLQREQALRFVLALYNSNIPMVAIENPIGYLSTGWRQPDQIISPHQFGDKYQKDVCFWLRGLDPLEPIVPGMSADPLPVVLSSSPFKKVRNHVNSRMNKEEKRKIKSNWKYFPKTAKAMAEQWG